MPGITRQREKPKNKNEIHKFWNFVKDEEKNTAELLLYGEISQYSWRIDDITPAFFNEELKNIGAVDEIIVRINSEGGDVFAAVAIYTRLKEHKAKITVKIDGWCMSAATIIAMSGDSIEISVGAIFMIHDPLVGLVGYYNTTDLSEIITSLEKIKQSIVNCYMTVTHKTEEEIKNLMANNGTWYTGKEAVEAGFCTDVMFAEVNAEMEDAETLIVNSVAINLNRFVNIPQRIFKDIKIKDREEEELTLKELKEKYPDVANAYRNEILAETGQEVVDAERARIKAIDEITLPGYEEVANKAKYEKPISAEAFAMQMIAEQKKVGQTFLNNREDDVNASGIKDVTPNSNIGGTTKEDDPFGDIIDKLYPMK